MVDQDEIEWQRRVHSEAQQAALVEAMRNTQQRAEYKITCVKFVEDLKDLRRMHPNHMEVGTMYNRLYNEYFGDLAQNNNIL
jgi:hypothetical protein